jgi:hypothetical protein
VHQALLAGDADLERVALAPTGDDDAEDRVLAGLRLELAVGALPRLTAVGALALVARIVGDAVFVRDGDDLLAAPGLRRCSLDRRGRLLELSGCAFAACSTSNRM